MEERGNRDAKMHNIESTSKSHINYSNNSVYGVEGVNLYIDCHRPRFWRWMRIAAVFMVILFTWQQISWAQGGQSLSLKPQGSPAGVSGDQLKDISIPKD
ncbi:MAG: hypothetical protein HQ575_06825, partial [Candidatus Omnitrophica bacterium]|nr:hypothetical protein [Candidatus Omnitrophota bacterium]